MAAAAALTTTAGGGAGGGQTLLHHRQQHILDTSLVAPAGPALPPRSIPLTFFDIKWLHLPPVERLLLYRLSPDADVPVILSTLRTSLSQALRAFYPMAGHVAVVVKHQEEQQSRPRHELSYRPGDAVPFTTAEHDIRDLLDDDPAAPVKVASLAPLVPLLPKGRAVLAVQATVLGGSRGRGLALGVTVHHSTCDGAGSTHFLHTWAALAAAGAGAAHLPPPPVIDRDLVADPRGLYDIYLKDMPPTVSHDDFQFVLGKHQDPDEDKVLATFTLPPHLLQSIKGAVAGEAGRRGMVAPPRCSSILATYGFIWSCYCQSQSQSQPPPALASYFLFSVDQRSRLKPPVPDKYFGNCCCPAIARAPRGELAAAAGLFTACAALAAALEKEVRVREGAQEERWDTCVTRVKEAVATGAMLSVAGSPRFRVYDLDFGFGPPAKVHMVSVAKTGAISVADAPPPRGGVEVGISLPADDMDRFRQSFADGIACLAPPLTRE